MGGPKQLKVLADKSRGDLELWYQGGGPKILGGAMNLNDAMLTVDKKVNK